MTMFMLSVTLVLFQEVRSFASNCRFSSSSRLSRKLSAFQAEVSLSAARICVIAASGMESVGSMMPCCTKNLSAAVPGARPSTSSPRLSTASKVFCDSFGSRAAFRMSCHAVLTPT